MPSDDELKRRRERVQYIEPAILEGIRALAEMQGRATIKSEVVLDLLDYIAHLEAARWGLREELGKRMSIGDRQVCSMCKHTDGFHSPSCPLSLSDNT